MCRTIKCATTKCICCSMRLGWQTERLKITSKFSWKSWICFISFHLAIIAYSNFRIDRSIVVVASVFVVVVGGRRLVWSNHICSHTGTDLFVEVNVSCCFILFYFCFWLFLLLLLSKDQQATFAYHSCSISCIQKAL